jgi:hypothetical protein
LLRAPPTSWVSSQLSGMCLPQAHPCSAESERERERENFLFFLHQCFWSHSVIHRMTRYRSSQLVIALCIKSIKGFGENGSNKSNYLSSTDALWWPCLILPDASLMQVN